MATIVDNLTKSQMRDYLDEMGLATRPDDDGDLFAILSADEDFSHDVVVFFILRESKLVVQAHAIGMEVSAEERINYLEKCNEWNMNRQYPRVYMSESNTIVSQVSCFLDEPLTQEYICNNVLKLGVATSWQFFKFLEHGLQ